MSQDKALIRPFFRPEKSFQAKRSSINTRKDYGRGDLLRTNPEGRYQKITLYKKNKFHSDRRILKRIFTFIFTEGDEEKQPVRFHFPDEPQNAR